LKPGLCLETDNGCFFRPGPQVPQSIPQDADAAVIAGIAQFFKVSLPRLNEPILLFLMDPSKVAGFEIYGENFTDIGRCQR